MTAICGGGASGPKPGVAEFVIYAGDELSTLLGNVKAWYVVALAGVIGVLSYDTITFCNTDPPTARSLTGAEWNSLLVLDSGFGAAMQQLVANIGNQVWYTLCQCSSTATPAAPSFPAAPTGVATNPTGTALNQCAPGLYVGTPGNDLGINLTQSLFPALAQGPAITVPGGCAVAPCYSAILPQPLPTNYQYAWQTTAGDVGETIDGEFIFYSDPSTAVQTTAFSWALNSGNTFLSSAIPASARLVYAYIQTNKVHPALPSGAVQISLSLIGNCGTPFNTCCPPVQTNNDGQLALILQKLTALSTQIGTPLQGYGSFLAGPVSTNKSGNFTLSATGAVACQIQLTTIPGEIGKELGNPNVYFDAGWVSSGHVGVATKPERIIYALQYYYFAPATDLAMFHLEPGVVATVTMLDRGP